MKKLLPVLLSLLLILNFSSQALAVNADDYWYQDSTGTWVYDYAGYDLAAAVKMVETAGLNLDPYAFLQSDTDGVCFDTMGFQTAYEQALKAKEEEAAALDPLPELGAESVGDTSGDHDQNVDIPDDLYPIGNYFADEDGNLYYPDGQLATGTRPAGSAFEEDPIPPDASENPEAVLDGEDASEDPQVEDEPAVFTVSDLRSGDDSSLNPLVGLKALIVSIFGEYTPVMTTAAVTETVGNETTTTLIDTVAPGAAGVDYAWIAGVLLFGILLFCLMKLLGGVLK